MHKIHEKKITYAQNKKDNINLQMIINHSAFDQLAKAITFVSFVPNVTQ